MNDNAIIALGSNIDPEYNIPYALKVIDEKFTIAEMSEFIYTKPLLYENQADFLNGAVLVYTELSADKIVQVLKEIEDEMKRNRNGIKNGPRNIDLDLIVYHGEVVDDDVYKRDFLQNSIRELMPELMGKLEKDEQTLK